MGSNLYFAVYQNLNKTFDFVWERQEYLIHMGVKAINIFPRFKWSFIRKNREILCHYPVFWFLCLVNQIVVFWTTTPGGVRSRRLQNHLITSQSPRKPSGRPQRRRGGRFQYSKFPPKTTPNRSKEHNFNKFVFFQIRRVRSYNSTRILPLL